jgi:hypothetical protein
MFLSVDHISIGNEIYLRNIVGEIIQSIIVKSETVQIEIENFAPRVYFIEVKGYEVFKFVKQ